MSYVHCSKPFSGALRFAQFRSDHGSRWTAAGTYTLNVDDQASSHNFHLSGPGGVDIKTDISATGTTTFTATLQKGTYKCVCNAHPSVMHGTLTVS